jgi:hypothetical protein
MGTLWKCDLLYTLGKSLWKESWVLVVRITGTQNLEDRCKKIEKKIKVHPGKAPTMLVIPPFPDIWGYTLT